MAGEPGVFLPLGKRISQDILVDTNKKIQFRDTGLYLQSSTDGQLDIVADTTIALSGALSLSGTASVANVVASNDVTAADRVTAGGLFLTKESFAAHGTATVDVGYIHIAPASAATIQVNIAAPEAGQLLIAAMPGAGTANVHLNAGTWDGTNDDLLFNAAGQALVAFGISTTRYVIVENIGTVTPG